MDSLSPPEMNSPEHLLEEIRQYFLGKNVFFQASTSPCFGKLRSAEAEAVEGVCRRRREDFLSGRLCAREALSQAGNANAVIPVGEDKEPVWPEGYCGSISHTDGLYCAAVARKSDCLSIGIDAENRGRTISPTAFNFIAAEQEQAALPGLDRETEKLLLFSAKESLYKLLFPLSKTWFSFDAAQAEFRDDSRIELSLTYQLAPDFPPGWSCQAKYFTGQDWVLTSIILPAGRI